MNGKLSLLVLAALALHSVPLRAADALEKPRLVYSKSFPASIPPYIEILVDKNGDVLYKEAPDDDSPMSVHIGKAASDAMFALADNLDHFTKPLESPLPVAFMGKKTLRYEDADTHEVQFNYSQDPNAQALLDWFERIAETERGYMELERTVKYDKLGVENALLQLEVASDRQRLIAPEQLLPLLDRVVRNESYMRISRERAAAFAAQIRAAAPAAAQ